MKIFILGEALEPHEKQTVDTWEHPHPAFSDHAFGHPDRARITIPLVRAASPHEHAIREHLEKHGYKLASYQDGHVEDKHGRIQKLGKVLQKTNAQHLLDRYASDPSRAGGSGIHQDHHVVISRHPHDVAGMTSTGHSWCDQSCMNFKTGSNRHYLPGEIKSGTHVAYLTHKDDHALERPVARIALKPFSTHHNDPHHPEAHTILRPETKVYGNAPDTFLSTVTSWAHQHFPAKEDQSYRKSADSYHDSGSRFEFGKAALGKALVHHSHEVRYAALTNPHLDSNTIHEHAVETLKNRYSWDSDEMTQLLGHPNVGAHTIDHHAAIASDKQHPNKSDAVTRLHDLLLHGDKSTGSHEVNASLWRYAKDRDPINYAPSIARRKNLPDHVVDDLIHHGQGASLVLNHNLSSHHVSKLLDHAETAKISDYDKLQQVTHLAANSGLTPDHVPRIVKIAGAESNDRYAGTHKEQIATRLAGNPVVPRKHIDELLDLDNQHIRRGLAGSHPGSLTPKHAGRLLHDASKNNEHVTISYLASRHKLSEADTDAFVSHVTKPNMHTASRNDLTVTALNSGELNLQPRHLKALHDANPDYGADIVRHPRANEDVISHVLESPRQFGRIVRNIAEDSNVPLTDRHIDTLMRHPQGRLGLASRASLPDHHLDRLVNEHKGDHEVRNLLGSNPNIKPHHLDALVEHSNDWESVAGISGSIRYNFRQDFGRYRAHPDAQNIVRKFLSKAQAVRIPKQVGSDNIGYVHNDIKAVLPAHAATSEDLHNLINLHEARVHTAILDRNREGAVVTHKDPGDTSGFFHTYLAHAPALKAEHVNRLVDASPLLSNDSFIPGDVLYHVNKHMSDDDVKKVHDHVMSKNSEDSYTGVWAGWQAALAYNKSHHANSRFKKLAPTEPE